MPIDLLIGVSKLCDSLETNYKQKLNLFITEI